MPPGAESRTMIESTKLTTKLATKNRALAADDGGLGETRPTAVAQGAPQARNAGTEPCVPCGGLPLTTYAAAYAAATTAVSERHALPGWRLWRTAGLAW